MKKIINFLLYFWILISKIICFNKNNNNIFNKNKTKIKENEIKKHIKDVMNEKRECSNNIIKEKVSKYLKQKIHHEELSDLFKKKTQFVQN